MLQNIMTGGASVEETLELWVHSLRSAKERIVPLFTQKRVAASACAFLDVLIGNEPRRTGWMRAETAGDPGPWRQQALLGRGHWNADALRDVVRDYVIEHLGNDDGVLVIDETGFLKKGRQRRHFGPETLPLLNLLQGTQMDICACSMVVICISDFKQLRGLYPGPVYRNEKPSYKIYRHP